MRILVGTLYTIDNEFEECCRALAGQTLRSFEHFVLRNLPNKEAHDTLFRTFMERAKDFDLFCRLDADMVIRRQDLLERVAEKFTSDPGLVTYSVAVRDFFTGTLIHGLNFYRSSVRWHPGQDNLFVDRCNDLSTLEGRREYDSDELGGSVDHSPNPAPFQAFHFGFHRALKCVQPGRVRNRTFALDHWQVLQQLLRNYRQRRDIRLGYAAIGFEYGTRGVFDEQAVSYSDPRLKSFFETRILPLSEPQIFALARRMRLLRFGFLPIPADYRWVFERQRVAAMLRSRS